ncbi:hypothetical protein [Rudaeicoccus suwonensis]|uniref:D-mannose binding lectin n=1 Tax=Rudaeicoccus suwonensis TaxID=657409 RepID=A0A561E7T2_9MICO|nr:hypothetical protein [Rudaeicoccus suwonensis]TWE11674.1 D-mannose binding lectin [Rudaeicoccus suwonensis]
MRTVTQRLKLKTLIGAAVAAAALSTAAITSPIALAATNSSGGSTSTRSTFVQQRVTTASKKLAAASPSTPSTLTACNHIQAAAQTPYLLSTNNNWGFFALPGAAAVLQHLHFPSAGDYSDIPVPTWAVYSPTASASDNTMIAFYCNGDLAVRAQSGALIWQSNTAGKGGKTITINNSGNLVMTNAAGGVVWQTGSRAEALVANTVLPSNQYLQYWQQAVGKGTQKVALSMYTNGDLAFSLNGKVLWHSNTKVAGSHAAVNAKGQLTVVSPTGAVLWSSNNGYGSANTYFDTGTGTIVVANENSTIIWRVPGTRL